MPAFFRAVPLAAFILTVPALAAEPAAVESETVAPSASAPAAKKAGEKKVCVSETNVGSRFPIKVCRTESEWQVQREQDREGIVDRKE